MPGENSIPELVPELVNDKRPPILKGLNRLGRKVLKSIKSLSLASTALLPSASLAMAQEANIQAMSFGASPKDILYFSMVIGAITATMISAVWLIRERSKVDIENTELRAKLRDLQAIKGRYNSLIVDSGQKVVIWEQKDKPTEILGSLPSELRIPASERDFLKFDRWLDIQSSTNLDQCLEKLRHDAQSFDIVVETARGDMLEVQGRVSGVCAFLRFVPLGDFRAKQALLVSERDRLVGALETFQNLLDVIEMPVWMRDSDGKLQWVNEAFSQATEAKNRQDVLDRGLELLGVQARENIKSNSTPERPFFDKLSTVVRGERRFFEVADSKSPSGSAGLAIDITAEEDIRSELENTLQGHVDLINNLSTPVAIFDKHQQLQFHNQAFQKLWGLDSDFLAGNPDNNAVFERLRADSKLPDQPGWREWKAEMLSVYHSADPMQHLWHLPDGQTVHVLANANPQGGTIWVFENLTEQVDLETKYNRLRQVQGQTIDHLAEGVCVFASDGTLALVNPAFRALWALNEDQVTQGTHIKSIVPECEKSYPAADGWRQFAEIITSLDDQRVIVEGRLELVTGLILDYALVPVTGGLTMLTFVNMSDSVRAERMLTEKNDALIKAESLKNDFVQHVSYELRSPLTNIMGFTDLVRTPEIGVLNDRQSEYLDHIATSSSVLLTIVNDILDLATVDAGIMKLDVENVEIIDLVEHTQRQVADRMKENLLTLNVDLTDAPKLIRGDFQRLKQILVKLLGNAANASPKGSDVDLVVSSVGDEVIFKVTDRGAGIPEEDIDRIFSRFESRGRNGQRGGAGLGLSIVHSFVGLHHGDVHIDSVLGEGTTVICKLPLNCENIVSQTA